MASALDVRRALARRAAGRPAVPVSAVVAGAAADANIAVTGIKQNDVLLSVIEFTAGVPADRTSVASINAEGVIRVSDDTTGNTLLVQYLSI